MGEAPGRGVEASSAPVGDGAAHTAMVVSLIDGLAPLRARVPVALGRAIDLLSALSRRLVAETGGREVRSLVDGWLAVWPSTPAAVQYALRMQRELLAVDWPTPLVLRPEAGEELGDEGAPLFRGLRLRQGVHIGRLELRDDGGGAELVDGPAVFQAARVASAARGGQIVLTEQAWQRMRGTLGGATVLRDLGSHELEGVPGVGRLFQVLPLALDARRFAPPRTRDGQRTNALDRAPSFVGRSGDLSALAELDDFGVRLVTITGEPGVGKSRLARQHAALQGARYREHGGVWVAEARSAEPLELVRAVGHALGLPLVFARRVEELVAQVGHALAARGRALLVLDVPGDGAGPILAQWLEVAPEARFVVTSPDRVDARGAGGKGLRVKGEVAYTLAPFPAPEPEAVRSADVVRLLVGRAQETFPEVAQVDPELLVGLVEVLGRNPLAVELGAGLLDRVEPAALVEALEGRSGGGLRVFDLVWIHLTEPEREVLLACALHRAGFDRSSLAPLTSLPRVQLEATLGSLLARGLVRAEEDPRAPSVRRYAVHPRVRAMVRARAPGRLAELGPRYADALLARCEPWAERAWEADGPEAVARVALEVGNLLEIVDWGVAPTHADPGPLNRALRALLVLQPLFRVRGPTPAFLDLLDRALERVDQVLEADPLLQVRVLVARADALRHVGRSRQARADLDRGQAIAERWADVEGEARCAHSLGLCLRDVGQRDAALEAFGRACRGFAEVGAVRLEAVARGSLGVVLHEVGRAEDAEAALQQAVGTLRGLGARHDQAMFVANLGLIQRAAGRWARAADLYAEALRVHRQTGERRLEGITLLNQGALQYHLAHGDAALASFEQAVLLAREVGDRRCEASAMANIGLCRLERGELGPAREALLQALAIHREIDDRRGEGHDAGWLAVLQHQAGQPDAARASWERALALVDQTGDLRAQATFLAWRAAFEAEQGRLEVADGALLQARSTADDVGDERLHGLVEVLAACVDRARGAPVDVVARRLDAHEAVARGDGELRLALRVARAALSG